MCIRDSGKAALQFLAHYADPNAVIRFGQARLARFLHATPTVSYTHLRAHETVLDLVCRLLLEKKKHTS